MWGCAKIENRTLQEKQTQVALSLLGTVPREENKCTRWNAVSFKPIFIPAKEFWSRLTNEPNLSRNRAHTGQNALSAGACCTMNVNTSYATFMVEHDSSLHPADAFCSCISPLSSIHSRSRDVRNVLKACKQ